MPRNRAGGWRKKTTARDLARILEDWPVGDKVPEGELLERLQRAWATLTDKRPKSLGGRTWPGKRFKEKA